MAKKTVRPDAPAASSPAPTRRRAPANARRSTTARQATPGDGAPAGDTTVTPQTFHTAADRQLVGEVPGQNPTYEEIAEAAYRRYLERGGQHGSDFDDWLEAERSLRSRQ